MTKQKKLTNQQKVLSALKRYGTASNVELSRIHYRFSDDIYSLRRLGHIIEVKRVGRGINSYKYGGTVDEVIYNTHKKLSDKIMSFVRIPVKK